MPGMRRIQWNCTVSGNTADYDGGGIYNYDEGTLRLTNCTISGNTANYGGGICNYGTLTLTNCTVSGNTASGSYSYGGGICNYGTLTLTNCTVSGNTAYCSGGIDNGWATLTLTNTIVSYNYASFDSNISHILPFGGSNNIIGLDPGFAVAPFFEDGVLVNADELDLSLTTESVAIDAGTNAAVDTETDLTGNLRIVAAWREIATVDIGAFEYRGTVARGPIETPSTVVTTLLDIVDETDGLISLREAISYAASGDTVTFDPALSNQRIVLSGAELTIDKNLTIDASAVGGMTIDADGKSRVFYISGGNGINPVELIGLTITGGRHAGDGGGICNIDGTLMLTGCTVSGNTSDDDGGGIYNERGTLMLTGCTVSGNTSDDYGGGICNFGGTLTLTNCTISGNTANYVGGGICNSGTLTLTNCTISGNTANYGGGGIYNYGTLTLTNCTVSGNTADYVGGGIYNDDDGTANFYNTIISQNTASDSGSDVSCYSGSLSAYNTLSSYTDWTESGYCLVYDPAKPLFKDAANGDYTLAENSQAIDKGNNDYVETETDLAGNPRIVNGIVDLGAYEFGSSSPIPEAPMITTGNFGVYVSYGANRHQIQWNAVSNTSGYELAYSADGSSWTTVSTSDTAAVVTGLIYGQNVRYRVRTLGTGSYTGSDWSAVKVFNVCPVDINGDGDMTGGDRVILVESWLSAEGEDGFIPAADINGDGDVTGADRAFLSNNWLLNVEDDADDLVYPPAKCTDAVFNEFASADLDVDLDLF